VALHINYLHDKTCTEFLGKSQCCGSHDKGLVVLMVAVLVVGGVAVFVVGCEQNVVSASSLPMSLLRFSTSLSIRDKFGHFGAFLRKLPLTLPEIYTR